MKSLKKDLLTVNIYDSRDEMGKAAGADIKACILKLLETKETINMIFAAAPSQNEVLASLAEDKEIPWNRVNAFHMDEYIGLPADAPQGFGNFLKSAIFGRAPFKSVNYINISATDANAECERYSKLLEENPTDIVVMGIGENGHIAFNDPPVADFHDTKLVKKVELDDTCRMQQVHDGCFPTFDDVPKYALTLTVPALMSAKYLICTVPAPTKANAVKAMLEGEYGEVCPATALRKHKGAAMFLDKDSAALVL